MTSYLQLITFYQRDPSAATSTKKCVNHKRTMSKNKSNLVTCHKTIKVSLRNFQPGLAYVHIISYFSHYQNTILSILTNKFSSVLKKIFNKITTEVFICLIKYLEHILHNLRFFI